MLRLYMDVHVKAAITAGVRRRGIDVVTAQEDGATRLEDTPLLDHVTALERVLFSQDDDLLAIARMYQLQGMSFAGLIYGHQLAATIMRSSCSHPAPGASGGLLRSPGSRIGPRLP